MQLLGYLSKLKSKVTETDFDFSKVHKRGGEYVESELQKIVDTDDKNNSVVAEIIARADTENRNHILVFCTGIKHAKRISYIFNTYNISSDYLSSKTTNRNEILNNFTSGKIRVLCNVDILTTGFDFPAIDMIVMLRPTMSAGLYMQIVGRGLRIKKHTDYCRILDFVGNIDRHGAIGDIEIPAKKKEGGIAPSKECPECMEIVPAHSKVCRECGFIFPIEEKKDNVFFRNDDINGILPKEMVVEDYVIENHVSKKTGIEMLKVKYYGGLSDPVIDEYLCINHTGYAKIKADRAYADLKMKGKPKKIFYKKDKKFFKIITKEW